RCLGKISIGMYSPVLPLYESIWKYNESVYLTLAISRKCCYYSGEVFLHSARADALGTFVVLSHWCGSCAPVVTIVEVEPSCSPGDRVRWFPVSVFRGS